MGSEQSFAQIFLEATGGERRTASPELEELLSTQLAACKAAWPAVSLDERLFLALLAEKTRGEPQLEQALCGLRLTELYLTCACAHAVPGAIAAFEARYLETIDPALGRLGLSAEKMDEAKQLLRRRLFVAEDDGKVPLILQYSGRGPLHAWVTMAATRRAINLLRDGGTVHLAVGSGFPEAGGKNRSAVHHDLICDLRDGEIRVDKELVYKNGRFVEAAR